MCVREVEGGGGGGGGGGAEISFPYISKLVLCTSAIRCGFLVQNNPKNLDPSHKIDLNFKDCF